MIYSILVYTLIIFFGLIFPVQTSAQASFKFEQPDGLGIKARTSVAPYAENQIEAILLNIITIFYAVGGIGVVVYFVWGSVDWIFSGGDKEKVAAARKKITNAIIGLVLLSLSFVIINIVGQVVGFNPLVNLQLRGLGDSGSPRVPK